MPPSMMNEQAISQSIMDAKMTKSATGDDISPMITSSSSTMVQPSSVILKTPHNVPPLLINDIGNVLSNVPTPPASAQQQNSNFPRGIRNRQTFHGKTEHNKV